MANKKYKLTDGNYWATDGVYDFDQGKTQREVNSDLSGAITSNTNFLKAQRISNVWGKKVSIIGDSMSTFDRVGYKIAGYEMFYPTGDVQSVNDTWWKLLLDASGAEIEVNASYSGSGVVARDGRPTFYARCSLLGNPDTILIALGHNDSADGVTLGTFDFTSSIAALDDTKFRNGYIKGIKQLQATYPNAQIIAVIFPMTNAYSSSIRIICNTLGVEWINSQEYLTFDTLHPNKLGMRRIAKNTAINLDNRIFDYMNKYHVGDTFQIKAGMTIPSNVGANSSQFGAYITLPKEIGEDVTGFTISGGIQFWVNLDKGRIYNCTFTNTNYIVASNMINPTGQFPSGTTVASNTLGMVNFNNCTITFT